MLSPRSIKFVGSVPAVRLRDVCQAHLIRISFRANMGNTSMKGVYLSDPPRLSTLCVTSLDAEEVVTIRVPYLGNCDNRVFRVRMHPGLGHVEAFQFHLG